MSIKIMELGRRKFLAAQYGWDMATYTHSCIGCLWHIIAYEWQEIEALELGNKK